MTAAEIQDYSQNGEQAFILECTPAQGRFLDVGAFAAEALSNTRALYGRGWSGVLVEPSPGPARRLIEAYAGCERAAVVCAAVGRERGLIEMHATDDAVSTTDPACYALWKDTVPYLGKFFTPVVTFADLINQFGPFDFVNIDTEGSSVDLLHNLLEIPMNPACICVEHDNRVAEAIELAQRRGYRVVHLNGTNLIIAKVT